MFFHVLSTKSHVRSSRELYCFQKIHFNYSFHLVGRIWIGKTHWHSAEWIYRKGDCYKPASIELHRSIWLRTLCQRETTPSTCLEPSRERVCWSNKMSRTFCYNDILAVTAALAKMVVTVTEMVVTAIQAVSTSTLSGNSQFIQEQTLQFVGLRNGSQERISDGSQERMRNKPCHKLWTIDSLQKEGGKFWSVKYRCGLAEMPAWGTIATLYTLFHVAVSFLQNLGWEHNRNN